MTDFEPEAINAALTLITHGVGMNTTIEGGSKELTTKASRVLLKLFDEYLDGDYEAEDNPGAANGAF